MKKKAIINNMLLLMFGIALWAGGNNMAMSVFYWIAVYFVFVSLSNIIKAFKSENKFLNIVKGFGALILSVFWVYNNGFAAFITVLFIGVYQLFLGIVCLFNFYLQRKDSETDFWLVIRGIIHLIIGMSVFFDTTTAYENMYPRIGLYVILLAIMNLLDAFNTTKKGKVTLSRRFRIRVPVFISAIFPMYSLRKDNIKEPIFSEKFLQEKAKASENKPVDLEVWVHTAEKGASVAGHVDISYKGLTYSYGHYDEDSNTLFGSKGDGVLWIVPSDKYIEWLQTDHSYRGVYRYGLHLTPKQRLIVEEQISHIMSNVYKFELTTDSQHKSFLGQLASRVPEIKIYKFLKTRFKTYFVLTTNCVLLADTIVGKTGFDIVSVSGISSPGSYKIYLDKEYRKVHSNVVTRKIQQNKEEEMLKEGKDLLEEKLKLEQESTKESKIIQFLGGKLSIYLLVMTILTFSAIWLYNQISGTFEPFYVIVNSMLSPVLVAFIFFYVLKPINNLLVKYARLGRGFASIVSILVGIVVVILVFVGAIPAIVEQTQHLITSFPGYVNTVKGYLAANSDNTIVKTAMDYINTNLNMTQISAKAVDMLSGMVSGAASTISSMATVIMTAPFVLYYLLKDSAKFHSFVVSKLPTKYKPQIVETLDEIDDKVGAYISGQMLVSLCIGVLLFIGYNIIGLPYAISLATLAAILSIVPYLGPVIAITPAMLVAAGDGWLMVVKMIVVWMVVQFLEGNFISPNVMGRSMNQHPLTVIFVVIIGANMMGIVGAIIGIPLYAVLKILTVKLYALIKLRFNRIYNGEEPNE